MGAPFAWDSPLLPERLREAYRPLSADADRTNLSPEARLKKTEVGRRLAVKNELDRMDADYLQNVRTLAAYGEGAALAHEALGPDAELGRKVVAGGRQGYLRGAGSHSRILEKRSVYVLWQQYIDTLHIENPCLTYRVLAKRAALKFGVHEKTIRNRTTNPRT